MVHVIDSVTSYIYRGIADALALMLAAVQGYSATMEREKMSSIMASRSNSPVTSSWGAAS
jgi:hypothetical protein